MFNDPRSNFNCLVASDAIGMGLNLAIQRIVFSTMSKFDGKRHRLLYPSEVKQIAGRAGRYQSIYHQGEVTCLHKDDMLHLRRCMGTDDKLIRKAGLHPSLEQLHLLSMIMHYSITSQQLMDFWEYDFSREYGSIGISGEVYDHPQWKDIGTMMKHFRDMEHFETTYQEYLSKISGSIPTNTPDAESSSHPYLKISKQFVHDEDILHQFMMSHDHVIDAEPQLTAKDRRRLLERLSPSKKQSRIKIEVNDGYTSEKVRIENTSLSKLLNYFRGKVDFVKDGIYFLCNIDDMIALAAIVDKYKQQLPLTVRFALSKAPVNNDDETVVEAFESFISEYTCSGKVSCQTYFDDDSLPPKTDVEVLRFEAIHRILDLYQWLSYRMPGSFDDLDLARQQASQCSKLINDALSKTHFNKQKKGRRHN
jgi:hypothetical protein